MKNIRFLFLIITIAALTAVSSACSYNRCSNDCDKNNTPAQNAIVSTVTDKSFTYPSGFYYEYNNKWTIYTCPCANNITEAGALFEYSNTKNARNYTYISDTETAKYYERTWNYGNGCLMLERIHKCSYFSVSCTSTTPDGYLITVNQASAKEFAEYYLLVNALLYPIQPSYGISDITSSNILDAGSDYVVTIGFIYCEYGSDWCICALAYTGETVITINKSTGAVTEVTTYSADKISF